MLLYRLIEILEKHPENKIVKYGFSNAHSYRGYYQDLAFEPARNISVGKMLKEVKSCLGKTFEGYKGGEYTMGEFTECWLSEYGHSSGESLGPTLLSFMLGEISND